jgi:ElaB/YqjD/DUF883 family membrane-anchored ribosome-binding protein
MPTISNTGFNAGSQGQQSGISATAQQKAQETRQGIQETAGEFKENIKQGASQAMGNLRDMGEDVKQRAQEGFETFRDTAADYMEQGRARAQDFGVTLERQIRAQPVTSILVAAGVGFLIGALWSRT